MNNIIKLVSDFDLLSEIAYDLSQQFDGMETEDRRKKLSTYFLAKTVPGCISLLRILPTPNEDFSNELLDFSSISSLCRNLIEGANLHWYYCLDEVTEEDINFRFLLYDYHDATTMMKIANNLNLVDDDDPYLVERQKEIRSNIEESNVFLSLNKDKRKQIIKGRKCTLLNQSEMAAARNIDIDEFNGIYKLLSNHVHSTPTSIKDVVYRRLHGAEMENSFAGLILHYSACFLAEMIRNIGDMWELEFAKTASRNVVIAYSAELQNGIGSKRV